MTEEQAERMINLLESMNAKLESIESNTSPAWDAHDICTRLDDVISLLDK